jgi:putative hydrolase of the HAD superfamily
MTVEQNSRIQALLFDFGGVLAEEGFREGLMAIARANGLDPASFFRTAADEAYKTGYVVGDAQEGLYWNSLREKTGIRGSDEDLRRELLDRFVIRPWMLDMVRSLRGRVLSVSILSDQTNWLDELNRKYDFFKEFSHVFNSYHLGKGKNDPSLFTDVTRKLGVLPARALFIDDNSGHIERARSRGLNTILYRDREHLVAALAGLGLEI